jgi:hypothetical protein
VPVLGWRGLAELRFLDSLKPSFLKTRERRKTQLPPDKPERLIRRYLGTSGLECGFSNRNPLHDIPRHAPPSAIVNLRGPRVRVPGEVLNVLEGHVLIEQIRHDRDPEAVRGEEVWQARILQTPLEHLPHGVRRVAVGFVLLIRGNAAFVSRTVCTSTRERRVVFLSSLTSVREILLPASPFHWRKFLFG